MKQKELSFQEFEKAFKYIKVILVKIFKPYLEEVVFPEKLKIAKVTPVFKEGDKENAENYRPISQCLNVLCMIVCMNIS